MISHLDSDVVKEAVSWLEKHTQPWELVVEKWKTAANFRQKYNETQKNLKVCDIFDRWPILKQPNGFEPIDADFTILNLTKTELTLENWFVFIETLRSIRTIKKDDENAVSLLKLLQLEQLSDGELNLITIAYVL